MDMHFRAQSAAWRYAVASYVLNPENMEVSGIRERLQTNINSLENLLLAKADTLAPETQQRILNSLAFSQQKREAFSELSQIEEDFHFPLFGRPLLRSFFPQMELFSDALAAVVLEDWHVMEGAVEDHISANLGEDIELVPGVPLESIVYHRGFHPDVDALGYDYDNWTKTRPHSQTTPMRSHLRGLFPEATEQFLVGQQMLSQLRDVLFQHFDENVVRPRIFDFEKPRAANLFMIEALTAYF